MFISRKTLFRVQSTCFILFYLVLFHRIRSFLNLFYRIWFCDSLSRLILSLLISFQYFNLFYLILSYRSYWPLKALGLPKRFHCEENVKAALADENTNRYRTFVSELRALLVRNGRLYNFVWERLLYIDNDIDGGCSVLMEAVGLSKWWGVEDMEYYFGWLRWDTLLFRIFWCDCGDICIMTRYVIERHKMNLRTVPFWNRWGNRCDSLCDDSR